MKIRSVLLSLLLSVPVFFTAAHAASSVLVWPIFQVIKNSDRGSELWLQNRGDNAVTLQVRIFKWQQRLSASVYSDQKDVLASPPFVTIQPGERQLIRLIRLRATAPHQEDAYRIVIDEIPGVMAPQTQKHNAGLIMRMRYVLPLFLYGQGVQPVGQNGPVADIRKNLSWQVLSSGGKSVLAITNHGKLHARLSDIFWGSDAKHPEVFISKGFLGYVLPGQTVNFPLPEKTALHPQLFTRLADNVAPVMIDAGR